MKPRKLRRIVLKEEFVSITGHHIAALILNQMLYWTERVADFDRFLLETQLRQRNVEVELQGGWIYKNAKQLADELMLGISEQTARRYLQKLVDIGFLQERKNPVNGWDRTMQYRVEIVEVVKALDKLGYTLEGYTKLEDAVLQNGASNLQNGASKLQNGVSSISKMEFGGSTMEPPNSTMEPVPYITETITEITTKNNNNNNNSTSSNVVVVDSSSPSSSEENSTSKNGPEDEATVRRQVSLQVMRGLILEVETMLPIQWIGLATYLDALTMKTTYELCKWFWAWQVLKTAPSRGGLYEPALYERYEKAQQLYGPTFDNARSLPARIKAHMKKEEYLELAPDDEDDLKVLLRDRTDELLKQERE